MRSLSKEQRRVVDRGLSSFFKHGVNSPQTAYVLGAFVTDGSCGLLTRAHRKDLVKGTYVKWDQKYSDYHWLQTLSKVICQTEQSVPIKISCQMDKRSSKIHFSSSLRLSNLCIAQNIASMIVLSEGERKSHHLRFPDIPDEHLPHFIRGVHDGDGSLALTATGKVIIKFTSSSERFLNSLRAKLIAHCFHGDQMLPKAHPHRTYHTLQFSNQIHVSSFLKWIYQDSDYLRLNRKYQRYRLCSETLMNLPLEERLHFIASHKQREIETEQRIFKDFIQQASEILASNPELKTQMSLEDPLLAFRPSFLRYVHTTLSS